MPAQYVAIRDKFVKDGTPLAEAKTRAAKIYNASHPGNPLRPDSPKKKIEMQSRAGKKLLQLCEA